MSGLPENAPRPRRIEHPPSARLGRMRFLSRLLDNSILLPGGYRIGLDPIIGLLPGVGDFFASAFSLWLIYDAARLGVRKWILMRMVGNVLVETIVGAVPVLGDLFDAAWKANARNMALVEAEYSPGRAERPLGRIVWFFLAVLVAVYGSLFLALWFVLSWVLRVVEPWF